MSVFHTEGADVNKSKILPQHPCRMIICGPSNCGKTNLLLNIITNPDMPWDSVHLFYGADQPKYELLERYLAGQKIKGKDGVEMSISKEKRKHQKDLYGCEGKKKGDKDEDWETPENKEDWVIPFEKFKGLPSAEWMAFLNGKERKHIPALIIVDDLMLSTEKSNDINKLFTIGSHHANCSIINLCQSIFTNKLQRNNADYYIIFNFDQDKTQIRTLFLQLEPLEWKELMEAYDEATSKPYSWFMVDLKCKNMGLPHLKYRVNGFDSILVGDTPNRTSNFTATLKDSRSQPRSKPDNEEKNN